MKTGTKKFVGVAVMFAVGAVVSGCSVPKFLQEPMEKGVYEDIMERQAQGVPVEEDTLKNLPEMTSADYEKLGDTYLSRGQMGLARSKYMKALDLHPGDWKLEYKIGTIYLRQNAPDEALPYFRSMTTRDPSNSRGWEGLGRAQLGMKDHESAETSLRKAVRLDSGNWKAQQALGQLYDNLGRPDDAITAYKAALRVRPVEASVLNNLGVAYYLKKDYPQSIETLEKALHTARPEDRKRVYNNLGRAFARSGEYPRAIDAFRRGSDLAVAYNNVGIVLLEEDRPGAAVACFQKAMSASRSYYAAAQENLVIAKDRARAGGGGGGTSACP